MAASGASSSVWAAASAASSCEWRNDSKAWDQWQDHQVAERRNNGHSWDQWQDSQGRSHLQQVAESAASGGDDFLQKYDEAYVQDLTQQQHRLACDSGVTKQSRRIHKCGKAFQNYRRAMHRVLKDKHLMKVCFKCWNYLRKPEELTMHDLVWTEDDMDHFLFTFGSFEEHKRRWLQKLEDRKDPKHKDHGKEMSMMVPASYIRVFQITLSQVHSKTFKQHFGASTFDGSLHTPIQLLNPVEESEVADSAAPAKSKPAIVVSKSAGLKTKFQLNLFMMDTRLEIDEKTSFLNGGDDKQLVEDVRSYRGDKLWEFVMKGVKKLAASVYGKKDLSPFQLHVGYQQVLGRALSKRWERDQAFHTFVEQVTKEDVKPKSQQSQEQMMPRTEVLSMEEHPKPQEVEELALEEDPKPQEEEELTLEEDPKPPEASHRPPLTDVSELDEALADLDPNVADEVPADLASTAASADLIAEVVVEASADEDHWATALPDVAPPQVAASAAVEVFPWVERNAKISAAATHAYDAIQVFRRGIVQNRIESCKSWIQKNMNDFRMMSIEVFGSAVYHLELCSSDVDIVAILHNGQNTKMWLTQLQARVRASPSFQKTTGGMAFGTLQTTYMGLPVDIKPIKSRSGDNACRSSDSLKKLVEKQLMKHGTWNLPNYKLQAVLIFKLVLHYKSITHHHWKSKGGRFKAVALCFWAIHVLTDMSWEKHSLADFLLALCRNFVEFDWRGKKLVVSEHNHISVAQKDIFKPVCIMIDGGSNNATSNVTCEHLQKSIESMKDVLDVGLDKVIEEALADQDIAGSWIKLDEERVERTHFEAMHLICASASSVPPPAKAAGSPATTSSVPPPAEVAGSAAIASPVPPPAKVAGSAAIASSVPPPAKVAGSPASAPSVPPPADVAGSPPVRTSSLPPPAGSEKKLCGASHHHLGWSHHCLLRRLHLRISSHHRLDKLGSNTHQEPPDQHPLVGHHNHHQDSLGQHPVVGHHNHHQESSHQHQDQHLLGFSRWHRLRRSPYRRRRQRRWRRLRRRAHHHHGCRHRLRRRWLHQLLRHLCSSRDYSNSVVKPVRLLRLLRSQII